MLGVRLHYLVCVLKFTNLQVKQIREALSELLLPPEVIDQALQKISGELTYYRFCV